MVICFCFFCSYFYHLVFIAITYSGSFLYFCFIFRFDLVACVFAPLHNIPFIFKCATIIRQRIRSQNAFGNAVHDIIVINSTTQHTRPIHPVCIPSNYWRLIQIFFYILLLRSFMAVEFLVSLTLNNNRNLYSPCISTACSIGISYIQSASFSLFFSC